MVDWAYHTDRARHTDALCPADSAGPARPAQVQGTAQKMLVNDSAEASAIFLTDQSLAAMPYVGTRLVAAVIAW